MKTKLKRVKLNLVGLHGNAFALLCAFQAAARQQGWTRQEIHDVHIKAICGDYNHLLSTLIEHTEEQQSFSEGDRIGRRVRLSGVNR